MKKIRNTKGYRPKPIPPFKTLDEEAEFWDTHDTSEFGKVPLLELPLLETEKEESLTLRLQKTVKSKLTRVARAKGVNVGTLTRMWLIERLSQVA
ncbi:MAG: CopG family antitoxin [Candidatus Gottesmanbacteria bacterium]|nr:CopG family antitoxin [Candidatus Gottesmanbacteria bacterium]